MGLLMVSVPTEVPPTVMLVGTTAKLMVGGNSALTVSVSLLLLVLLPPAMSAPGVTVAVYAPGVGLCTVSKIVQLPSAGILPMPKE